MGRFFEAIRQIFCSYSATTECRRNDTTETKKRYLKCAVISICPLRFHAIVCFSTALFACYRQRTTLVYNIMIGVLCLAISTKKNYFRKSKAETHKLHRASISYIRLRYLPLITYKRDRFGQFLMFT